MIKKLRWKLANLILGVGVRFSKRGSECADFKSIRRAITCLRLAWSIAPMTIQESRDALKECGIEDLINKYSNIE